MITASGTAGIYPADVPSRRGMDFIALTIGLLVLLVLILAGLARAFQGHSVAELLDWKPTRSPEVEAQNEVDDVRQMIEAQNEYRRKRGAGEITEADVQRQAQEDQAVRARGRGPFAQGGGIDDEFPEAPPPSKPRPSAKAKKRAPAKRAGTKRTAGKSAAGRTAGKRAGTKAPAKRAKKR